MKTYEIVIWSAFIGVSAASLYAYYVKHIIGNFIRKLLAEEIYSESNAVSLSQFSKIETAFLRFSLRKGSSLHDTVSSTSEGLYFIPEANADKARIKYKSDIKLYQVVIAIAVFFVISLLAEIYYEDLYRYAMDFYNSLQ